MISSPHSATPATHATTIIQARDSTSSRTDPILQNPTRPQPCSGPDTHQLLSYVRLNEAYSTCNTSLQGSERSLNVGTAAYDNTPVEQLLQGKKYRQEAIEAQFDHTDPHLTGQPSGPVELQRESLRQRNNSVNDNDLRSTVAHTYIAPEHIERKHSNLTPHQPRRSFYNNTSELARPKNPTTNKQTNTLHLRDHGLEPLLHLAHAIQLLLLLARPVAQLRTLLGRLLLQLVAPRIDLALRPPTARRLPPIPIPQAAPAMARARTLCAPTPVQGLLCGDHAVGVWRRAA